MKANEILRNRRIEIGLSQKEVAEKLGIPTSSFSCYELGRMKLTNDIAKKMADFYNINYKVLTGEKRIYIRNKKEDKEEKKRDIEDLQNTLLEKFEKIYQEEIKNLKEEALKRTYKRLKKEI